MDAHSVGRIMSMDYLVFVPAVAVAFNVYLAATRKWKELAIFNIAGILNLTIEVLMVRGGTRQFNTDVQSLKLLTMICLGWVTNGFVFTLAYVNVRQWLKKVYSAPFVIAGNVIYFVVLPLAMFNWGIFEGGAQTTRDMQDMVTYIEPAVYIVFAAIIWALGYKQVLWRLFLVGFLLDLGFEGSLFISGVRPIENLDIIKVGGRVLFEMNLFFCIGFLALKGIFKLNDYKDASL